MPRKARPRKSSAPQSPEPTKASTSRKTPSRACKKPVKYESSPQVRTGSRTTRTRSKIPTPIAEKSTTSRVNMAAESKDSDDLMTSPNPSAGILDRLNASSRSAAESRTTVPQPSMGLAQQVTGFSDDDTDISTLNMENKAIGIGDFNFDSSPQRKFDFAAPTELSQAMTSKAPFKFDFATPAIPKIDTPITNSLLALQKESIAEKIAQAERTPSETSATVDMIQVGRPALLADTPSNLLGSLKQVASIKRAHKNRLSTFLRQRISFKKNEPAIRSTEDAGDTPATDEPTALQFNATKQLYVNVPLKARLVGAADSLGMGFLSIFLHAVIFMCSFWICNLLYTFWFPATEDERVNYFYEMLTRQQVGSFYVHFKHFERWFRWPRCQPEFLALICTIAASASIARLLRRSEDHNTARKIKLVKLC